MIENSDLVLMTVLTALIAIIINLLLLSILAIKVILNDNQPSGGFFKKMILNKQSDEKPVEIKEEIISEGNKQIVDNIKTTPLKERIQEIDI